MTLLYCSPCFLDHETGDHPERAARIAGIPRRLEEAGLWAECAKPDYSPVSRQRLTRVHTAAYVDQVGLLAKSGGGYMDAETIVSPASFDVAQKAAGCVCDAVERLVRGEDTQGLCLVRPPGHHATANRAMGFCLFNNVAVAARLAIDALHLDHVLIVDWDVHHGNGTQAAFWSDPQVGYLSMHRWPFYPGTGDSDETGEGRGLGTTLNLPIRYGTPAGYQLRVFGDRLQEFAAKIRPQLILISAGFDSHRLDPIGDLGLETEDFASLTNMVLDAAEAHAGGRLVSVLEGGYNPPILADCVAAHLSQMLKRNRSLHQEDQAGGGC